MKTKTVRLCASATAAATRKAFCNPICVTHGVRLAQAASVRDGRGHEMDGWMEGGMDWAHPYPMAKLIVLRMRMTVTMASPLSSWYESMQ